MLTLLLSLSVAAGPASPEADRARASLALALALQSLPKGVTPISAPPVVVKPPAVKDTAKPGQHLHQCPRCGTQWVHGTESYNNVAAHTCPKCGAQAWTPYSLPRPPVQRSVNKL